MKKLICLWIIFLSSIQIYAQPEYSIVGNDSVCVGASSYYYVDLGADSSKIELLTIYWSTGEVGVSTSFSPLEGINNLVVTVIDSSSNTTSIDSLAVVGYICSSDTTHNEQGDSTSTDNDYSVKIYGGDSLCYGIAALYYVQLGSGFDAIDSTKIQWSNGSIGYLSYFNIEEGINYLSVTVTDSPITASDTLVIMGYSCEIDSSSYFDFTIYGPDSVCTGSAGFYYVDIHADPSVKNNIIINWSNGSTDTSTYFSPLQGYNELHVSLSYYTWTGYVGTGKTYQVTGYSCSSDSTGTDHSDSTEVSGDFSFSIHGPDYVCTGTSEYYYADIQADSATMETLTIYWSTGSTAKSTYFTPSEGYNELWALITDTVTSDTLVATLEVYGYSCTTDSTGTDPGDSTHTSDDYTFIIHGNDSVCGDASPHYYLELGSGFSTLDTTKIQWSTGSIGATTYFTPGDGVNYLWAFVSDSSFTASDTLIVYGYSCSTDSTGTDPGDLCTNYVTVYDTVTVTEYDTTYVTIYDSVKVTTYDTVYITVTDTLIINAVIAKISDLQTNKITIYPNPAKDHLIIDYGEFQLMENYRLKILNSLGQEVYTTSIKRKEDSLDLSAWSGTGIYFVHIIDDTGHTVDIRKIVLQ